MPTLLLVLVAPAAAPQARKATATSNNTSAGSVLSSSTAADESGENSWELRSRTTQVETSGFAKVCNQTDKAPQLVFNLFEDLQITAITTMSRINADGLLEWRGKIVGADGEQVILSARHACAGPEKPLVSADFNLVGHHIILQPLGPGLVRVVEVEPAVPFTEPLPPIVHSQQGASAHNPQAQAGPLTAFALQPTDTCTATGTTLDLMALYTPAAAAHVGGAAAIEMAIANAVTWTNQAYANSGINARMRLVHTQEATGYSGSEEVTEALLSNLADSTGPGLSNVSKLRDQYGADLVTLVTITPSGNYALGVGYTPSEPSPATESYGFSIASIRYKFPMILAHETGHNQGANHDWLTTPRRNELHPYDHGYVPPSKAWHTIMAYNSACDGCAEAPLYSNPQKSYRGEVAGVAEGVGIEQPADNARMLNEFAPAVEAYREAVSPAVLCSLTTGAGPTEGGAATAEVPGPYAPGVNVSVTATPQPGYTFTGWTLDGLPYGSGETTVSVLMDSDHALTATFAPTLQIPLIDPWIMVVALALATLTSKQTRSMLTRLHISRFRQR
ncbi:reprolysin-like metallopeptidase [Streptomyces lavendulocolor]|uniref:reprolysin-like metallopeptidase n=1 Tax=Streptomyces lavendulocolor TaxID=67316 RepID=UPI0033E724B5